MAAITNASRHIALCVRQVCQHSQPTITCNYFLDVLLPFLVFFVVLVFLAPLLAFMLMAVLLKGIVCKNNT